MYLNEMNLIGFVGQDAKLKTSQNSKELDGWPTIAFGWQLWEREE